MPTYEYLCRGCSHRFETWQKMTDEPLTTCPECGGDIRRVLFPAGIVFKGSGFYKTDHNGSGSGGGENGHKKSESAEPGKESESKTSSESEAKTSSESKANSSESGSDTSAGKPGENKVAAGTK